VTVNSYAYIVTSTGLTTCTINNSVPNTGNFVASSCSNSSVAAFNNPNQITIDPNGQYLYVVNGGGSMTYYVVSCPISSTGSVTTTSCTTTGGASSSPLVGVAMDPSDSYGYLSNIGSNVYSCSLNSGVLNSCSAMTGTGLPSGGGGVYGGIALAPSGHAFAYLAYQSPMTPSIYSCAVSSGT
jgi:6-phosphogluconolactonase (cycloisomerase 2 family)